MDNLLLLILSCTIIFEGVLLLNTVSNLRTIRRMGQYHLPDHWPTVSILVPARNEEENIGLCVSSLLAQQYANFEVLVLDDHSNDNTWQILTKLSEKDERLKILRGKPLPPGWLGKHWACEQLAQAATGDLLLFTDADTRHHPLALPDSVAALVAEEADLLTALPQEEVGSWAERLVIPFIPWSIIALLPLRLAHHLKSPILSATIGQFMLFRRQAYEQIGGHRTVRQHCADDLALGRLIKASGMCWRLIDGSERVNCRMYHDFQQVYEGISKNLFAAFNYRTLAYVLIWSWLEVVVWTPLLLAVAALGESEIPYLVLSLVFMNIVLALILWGIIYHRFGFPPYLTPLYPLTMLLVGLIALRSLMLTKAGRTRWKGRYLIKQRRI